MIREEELKIVEDLDEACKKILFSKSIDYATEDVLSNFKRLSIAARALDITLKSPMQYALFMVLMKLDRINNLVNSEKTPNNESIEDSFADGINYLKLALCCYKDQD